MNKTNPFLPPTPAGGDVSQHGTSPLAASPSRGANGRVAVAGTAIARKTAVDEFIESCQPFEPTLSKGTTHPAGAYTGLVAAYARAGARIHVCGHAVSDHAHRCRSCIDIGPDGVFLDPHDISRCKGCGQETVWLCRVGTLRNGSYRDCECEGGLTA